MKLDTGTGQGIERLAAILRALCSNDGSGHRLVDVAETTGLSKSTVHRLLNGLVRVGLVEHDDATGRFHLGFELFALGSHAANRYGIADIARDSLRRLAILTGDTVFLSVRSGTEAICVDRAEGDYPIKVLTLSAGDRRPLGVGAGSLALLAFLADEEVDRLLIETQAQRAEYPNFNTSELYGLISEAKRRKYTFNGGRIVTDMCAIGVPIFDTHGRPVAALSVAAIKNRMKPERQRKIVGWLTAEAERVANEIKALTEGLSETSVSRLLRPDDPARLKSRVA
jgi:DNA-binding IclR family transcriptional regulator